MNFRHARRKQSWNFQHEATKEEKPWMLTLCRTQRLLEPPPSTFLAPTGRYAIT